ncbi:hypothetical protein MRX96_023386 [Rhipicephalus microplus]
MILRLLCDSEAVVVGTGEAARTKVGTVVKGEKCGLEEVSRLAAAGPPGRWPSATDRGERASTFEIAREGVGTRERSSATPGAPRVSSFPDGASRTSLNVRPPRGAGP